MDDIVNYLVADKRTPKIPGIMYATVTKADNGDYMLMPNSSEISVEIGPARLATMMTGDKYGTFFGPSVGDEVVIAFELGDLARPVILGSLWNPDHKPPDKADQGKSNNIRTLVTRSKHEITFDDTQGKERITVKSSKGYEIIIEDSPTQRVIFKTSGSTPGSKLVFDGVTWDHQHATGTGPSGPPLSIVPADPIIVTPEDQ